MRKKLKIFTFGEYRQKKSRDSILIKNFDTSLVLEVDDKNSLKHELIKEDRLLKHLRANVDEYASSIRVVEIRRSQIDYAVGAHISVDDLDTGSRELLVSFIDQEELPIKHENFLLKSELKKEIMKYVQGAAKKEEVKEEIVLTTDSAEEEERKEASFEEAGSLDDRGMSEADKKSSRQDDDGFLDEDEFTPPQI